MIAMITAILGALTGMVPGVLQFFTLKANNAQALEIEKLRQQGAKDGIALQVDLANSQADIQQQQSLYAFGAAATGIKWVDAATSIIRPYITLIVFHVWIGVEVALLWYGINKGFDIAQLARTVWDENTQAVFSAIVGFWFGNRMLARSAPMTATAMVTPQSKTITATAEAAAPKPVARPVPIIPAPAGSRD